jgi:nucleotidyltransferase-like protein
MGTAALPEAADAAVRRYLRVADRLLPGRVTGFYLVGSVALGGFRPDHSDIDFVAVVDGDLSTRELRRLRLVHLATAARNAAPHLVRGRFAVPGTCNGAYVRAEDMSRPVTEITPLASHVGHEFHVGGGFDVNLVQWATLATRGVTVRGPEPAALGLDTEPDRLRQWNLDNMAEYWVPWATKVEAGRDPRFRTAPRFWTAWGALGPPRLHHTALTGQVISKEEAGEHARATFDPRWHPLIDEALAYRRGEPTDPRFRSVRARSQATGAFALEVAAATAALAS